MNLLITDTERFERLFPDAAAFLITAELRKECFSLACEIKRRTQHEDPRRTVWTDARFAELRETLACREPWFQEQLRCEFGYEPIETSTEETTP